MRGRWQRRPLIFCRVVLQTTSLDSQRFSIDHGDSVQHGLQHATCRGRLKVINNGEESVEFSPAEKDRIASLSPGELDDELQAAGYTAYARRHPEYSEPDVKLDPETLPDTGSPADKILLYVRSDARRNFLRYLEEAGRVRD